MRAKIACVWLPVCFRAVTESINQLITLCTQQAAGQKECDNALRELEVAVLTYTVPHTETSYSSGLFLLPVHACMLLIRETWCICYPFLPSLLHLIHGRCSTVHPFCILKPTFTRQCILISLIYILKCFLCLN